MTPAHSNPRNLQNTLATIEQLEPDGRIELQLKRCAQSLAKAIRHCSAERPDLAASQLWVAVDGLLEGFRRIQVLRRLRREVMGLEIRSEDES